MNFTRTSGVVSAALQRDIALQKLGEADAAYREIDQERVETERRLTSLHEQLKSFPSRSVTVKRWADNPEALEKMKTHLLELQLKRTELRTRFEPSYRLVQEVEQQIADIRDRDHRRSADAGARRNHATKIRITSGRGWKSKNPRYKGMVCGLGNRTPRHRSRRCTRRLSRCNPSRWISRT